MRVLNDMLGKLVHSNQSEIINLFNTFQETQLSDNSGRSSPTLVRKECDKIKTECTYHNQFF